MRVLRFLRPVRTSASPIEATDSLGLDAFATEAAPPGRRSAREQVTLDRLRLAIIILAVVAIAEAVPAFFWLQAWMNPPTVAIAAPAPVLPSAVVEAAAPCTPTPAPAAVAAALRPEDKTPPAAARVAAPALVAGLVSIDAPVPMHVYADGRLVGTTEADTIMLPVGTYDLELVSDLVGLRTRRPVTIQSGRTTDLLIEAPRVPVHVNAVPWAEVWVDNQKIGETPIGNYQQTIGTHEFVFRHPELGERRATVLVTLKEPVRVSMDLRKR